VLGGLSFVVPYVLTAIFLGPEFPSILGALVGLVVLTIAAKRGFLAPRDRWDFAPRSTWPAEWLGTAKIDMSASDAPGREMPIWLAWFPYVLVAALLVISRLPELGVGAALKSVLISWNNILDTGIDASSTPLYLPGTILVVVVFITFWLHRMSPGELLAASRESCRVLLGAGIVLVFTVPMVRVYINSGFNDVGLASMPLVMAEWVSVKVGALWPLFAPSIGALGAFIAGSNTISNLMFSAFQYGVSHHLMISGAMILALQAVGAAAGNMIAIHNVVAASATVGLQGQEGATLRKTILPTLYYVTVVGILGFIAISLLGLSDPVNAELVASAAGN